MAKNPTTKQYKAKYFNFDFLTIEIIQVQAKTPATKAAIKPPDNTGIEREPKSLPPSKMSLAIFPKINGTTIKKEKRAAFSLSIPNKTAVEIVAPDLDIPGNMAIA